MKTPQERLDHCDHEIAQAIEESRKSHTQAEHVGILLWEMDWRAERDCLLAELTGAEGGSLMQPQRFSASQPGARYSPYNQEKEPTPYVE